MIEVGKGSFEPRVPERYSRFSLGLSAVVVLALWIFAGAAPAAASVNCSSSYDAYTLSSSELAACGDQQYPLASKSAGPSGATDYTFNLPNETITYVVPPASFDAATASEAVRESYGIPAEPSSNSPEYSPWQEMVSNLHVLAPPSALVKIPVQASVDYANWSGYEDDYSSNKFIHATSYYVEPNWYGNACNNQGSAVTWAGLGGVNSNRLAQAGTGITTPGLGQHQAWSEVLPSQGSIVPQNLYATAGYEFIADVQEESATQFHFYLYNYYNGATLSYYVNVSQDGWDGTTAEFIVERPR